jgi:hypothetical protein
MADHAPPSRTGDVLRRAFAIVHEDVPAAYAQMLARAPRTMLLDIDGDRLVLTRGADAIDVDVDQRADVVADVRVSATTDTLLAVLDGASTLLDALLDGSIFVAGDTRDLAEAQAALSAFLQGSVRTPRMPALLEEIRADRQARSASTPTTGREAA